MKRDNTSIAGWLRALRLQAGYSQQNIADELGVNRSTYTYYESGKTVPDLATLNRISLMYNVPLDIFMSDETPEMAFASDIGGRRRAPKKPSLDPQKIGDLTSSEKQLVAFIRDRDLDIEDVLELVRRHFPV